MNNRISHGKRRGGNYERPRCSNCGSKREGRISHRCGSSRAGRIESFTCRLSRKVADLRRPRMSDELNRGNESRHNVQTMAPTRKNGEQSPSFLARKESADGSFRARIPFSLMSTCANVEINFNLGLI